jgi:antitoxin HigA-1
MRTKSKSPITTDDERLPPVHPGDILGEEFIKPLGLTVYRVAVDIGVAPPRINEIVLGQRAITADTACRLARYFGTSEQFWMNLQTQHDLAVAHDLHGAAYQQIAPLDRKAAAALVQRPRSGPKSAPARKVTAPRRRASSR